MENSLEVWHRDYMKKKMGSGSSPQKVRRVSTNVAKAAMPKWMPADPPIPYPLVKTHYRKVEPEELDGFFASVYDVLLKRLFPDARQAVDEKTFVAVSRMFFRRRVDHVASQFVDVPKVSLMEGNLMVRLVSDVINSYGEIKVFGGSIRVVPVMETVNGWNGKEEIPLKVTQKMLADYNEFTHKCFSRRVSNLGRLARNVSGTCAYILNVRKSVGDEPATRNDEIVHVRSQVSELTKIDVAHAALMANS
ncbi:unnamed protein product [Caenorhabditis auriculariae]|uniref:Uncharacterized protein n=1 Tax=Caenorhabditis auriculariae TaxID=2777116 RepID=A0A8S1HSF7_9PELO|nr:unnamed protein product [Caenorhabditis auriculariae]